jgi:hypothetical protein
MSMISRLKRQQSMKQWTTQKLRAMNKEEEQIASFKYLRILGSHLKNSNSPEETTDPESMRKKFSQINLSSFAHVNQLSLSRHEQQYLKYNNYYLNYND